MPALDDATLARLGHLNLMEFSRESARWSGASGAIVESDGMLFFQTGAELPFLCNGAFRLDERVPAPALVAAADEWFGERSRGFTIFARPGIDDDLADACAAAGFHAFSDSPEMVCEEPVSGPPLPDGVELRGVSDAGQVADFVAVSQEAYGDIGMPDGTVAAIVTEPSRFLVPHVRSVVAYLDGRPVAAAQTVLSHGLAGVYWVGTVADARGRGLGEAVTRAVTNLAFELGAPANSLQASKMGEPIYRRMGYRTIYRYRSFVRFADG